MLCRAKRHSVNKVDTLTQKSAKLRRALSTIQDPAGQNPKRPPLVDPALSWDDLQRPFLTLTIL